MNRSLQVLRLEYLDEEAGEAIAVLRDLIRRRENKLLPADDPNRQAARSRIEQLRKRN